MSKRMLLNNSYITEPSTLRPTRTAFNFVNPNMQRVLNSKRELSLSRAGIWTLSRASFETHNVRGKPLLAEDLFYDHQSYASAYNAVGTECWSTALRSQVRFRICQADIFKLSSKEGQPDVINWLLFRNDYHEEFGLKSGIIDHSEIEVFHKVGGKVRLRMRLPTVDEIQQYYQNQSADLWPSRYNPAVFGGYQVLFANVKMSHDSYFMLFNASNAETIFGLNFDSILYGEKCLLDALIDSAMAWKQKGREHKWVYGRQTSSLAFQLHTLDRIDWDVA